MSACTQGPTIMQNLTASIPHRLGREEARRRIQAEIGTLRREHGALLHGIQESWAGDRLGFSFSILGQPIRGHAVVEDQVVHLEVELPWLLAMLAGPAKLRVDQQGRKLLSGSPPR
jgi:Putative polyhydroxyalkanoic acid system protein (PHA_gran_rgn)